MAIIALGTEANPLVQSTTPDLKTTRKGYIAADPETLRTSKRGVFAGGDIVTGGATVILAMGAGRKAAASIDEYLRIAVNGSEGRQRPAAQRKTQPRSWNSSLRSRCMMAMKVSRSCSVRNRGVIRST